MRVSLFGLSSRGINLMNVWFSRFCTFHHLMPHSCSCVLVLTTRFPIHSLWFRFIDTRVPIYAYYLAFTTPLVGEFLTPLNPHVKILEFEPWWTSCWSEWRNRSVVNQQKISLGPYSSGFSCSSLGFSFCNSWAHFILFIIVYLFVFSHLRLSVM